jgi:NAD(P)H-dependent flavin oxidoreductase YrpB (nitropropane dioxygenase family)
MSASEPRPRVHPALRTRFAALCGIDYPIVQTGMGWVSGARLTAATAQAGGLGIIASATMGLAELAAAIHEVKSRTERPFGVNLRADQPDLKARIALLEKERVRVASFAAAPDRDAVRRLKDAGILVVPTVGARRHAEKVAAWGVDAVIAQGHEGGGHTGAIPTSILLPQVCRAIDIPVLGAGGFSSGQGLVAALAWGASGVAMGTRFLLTRESTVPDGVKRIYLATDAAGTVVTRAIDGLPQRVIRTTFVERLERSGPLAALWRSLRHALALRAAIGTSLRELGRQALALRRHAELSLAQLALAPNAPMLTRAALVDGRTEAGILPTGQVVGSIDELPSVAELMQRIVSEAESTLARLAAADPEPASAIPRMKDAVP